MTSIAVSILVSTRDRAASLAQTLNVLQRCDLPADVPAELLVVDNGSRDATAEVLREAARRQGVIPLRSLYCQTPGKSRALNVALKHARGQVLLFTDDDVRPPTNWVERMVRPILDGYADAVAGGVRLAPSLHRPWISAAQRRWLASTEDLPPDANHPLIGANMSVSRLVFDTVLQFDRNVGPGAIGHAEDTLFWLQVRKARFRIVTRLDVEVEHHLPPERLSWRAFAAQARKRGEFAAYVEHHWEWFDRPHPRLAWAKAAAALAVARLKHFPSWIRAETMPAWELDLAERYHARRCLLRERRRPRKYKRHGLVRQDVDQSVPPDLIASSSSADAAPWSVE